MWPLALLGRWKSGSESWRREERIANTSLWCPLEISWSQNLKRNMKNQPVQPPNWNNEEGASRGILGELSSLCSYCFCRCTGGPRAGGVGLAIEVHKAESTRNSPPAMATVSISPMSRDGGTQKRGWPTSTDRPSCSLDHWTPPLFFYFILLHNL